MAYKTEIQVAVNGAAQLKVLQDRLERINALTTRINRQASTKFVNLGRLNSETQALRNFNKELEKNLALSERGQSIRPSGVGARGGGGAGRGGGTDRGAGGGVNRFESAALGVGFPLLFGGGAGQVLGGLAGSFVGTGFGGQILGSALGGAVEQFLSSTASLGNALSTTAPNFDRLIDALGGANNEVGERIRLLEELEGKTAALNAAQQDLADLIGGNGVAALKEYGDDVALIGSEFSKFFTIMQTNIAELINSSGILKAIIEQVGRATLFAQAEREKQNDPELALLFAQRRNVAKAATSPNFLGVDTFDPLKAKEIQEEIDQKIIERQTQLNGLKSMGNQEELEGLRIKKQGIEKQKEQGKLERAAKKLTRETHQSRVTDLKVQQSGVQIQLNQLNNEQKIFELRNQTAASAVQVEQSRFAAQISTLQLQEAGLQRELKGLQQKEIAFNRQKQIINQIAKNRVEQAKIENKVAKLRNKQGILQAEIAQQQIQFEVQRIKLQIQMAKLKAEEIQDEERREARLREVAATEKQTLALTDEMVKAGDERLKNSREIAKQNDKIADNILKGKLQSIEAERVEARRAVNAGKLAKQTRKAADEAGRLNSNMSRGISSGGIDSGPRKGRTSSTKLKIDPDVYERVVADASRGLGFKNVYELTEALDIAQRSKNTQAEQRAEAAKREEERQAAFSYMNSLNAPSSSSYRTAQVTTVPVRNAMTKAPVVNVNTGPVMEFDGSKYVSVEDFEKGLANVARSQATTSRSYGGRNYAGVS